MILALISLLNHSLVAELLVTKQLYLMAEPEQDPKFNWGEITLPEKNVWTLNKITGFMRLAADTNPSRVSYMS